MIFTTQKFSCTINQFHYFINQNKIWCFWKSQTSSLKLKHVRIIKPKTLRRSIQNQHHQDIPSGLKQNTMLTILETYVLCNHFFLLNKCTSVIFENIWLTPCIFFKRTPCIFVIKVVYTKKKCFFSKKCKKLK